MAEAKVPETNKSKAADFSFVVSVSADPGEDVILPVHLSPETSAVPMNIRWFKGTELMYQYKNGLESKNSEYENQVSLSIQELERGNLSLTLRNVQESDSGNYTCHVYHDKCLRTVIVHLQVRGERQLQRQIVEQQRRIKKLEMDGRIKEMEQEKQTMKLETEKQIKELENQILKLEMEKQIKELEKQIMKLETEKQIKELEKQIMKLEMEKQIMKLEMEREKMEMERVIEDLDKRIQELPIHTHGLHGPTPRHRNSFDGVPPNLADDTLEAPETEEERETSDTVERWSDDQNTTQTGEESTVFEQETPGTSSHVLQSTSETVISPARATQTQGNPEEPGQSTQERRQESDATEQDI